MYETLVAQFDFPVLKTGEQLQKEREQASANVIPYYRYSENIVNDAQSALRATSLGKYDSLKSALSGIMSAIYEKGIIEPASAAEQGAADNDVIFVQREKRASEVPATEVFTTVTAKQRFAMEAGRLNAGCDVDSLCRYSGVYDLLIPNLIFDRQTTDLVHEESVNYVSPTSGVVNSGQLIVSKGEMITSEIEQLLDSYKAEYESSFGYTGPRFLLWLGDTLIALIQSRVVQQICLPARHFPDFVHDGDFRREGGPELPVSDPVRPYCAVPQGVLQEKGCPSGIYNFTASSSGLFS